MPSKHNQSPATPGTPTPGDLTLIVATPAEAALIRAHRSAVATPPPSVTATPEQCQRLLDGFLRTYRDAITRKVLREASVAAELLHLDRMVAQISAS